MVSLICQLPFVSFHVALAVAVIYFNNLAGSLISRLMINILHFPLLLVSLGMKEVG